MKNLFKTVLVLALTASMASLSLPSGAGRRDTSDIVDTAVASGQFTTLVAAVKAAGLVEDLKGPGPLTVFAPTDAAFKKIPSATLAELLKPENKAKLKAILLYHVLSGRYTADDVMKLKSPSAVATLDNSTVKIRHGASGVFVNKAHVIKADIVCSNGIIHVIDTVLIPK